MARTRLFSALKRWARLAWRAERQRPPTREYVEQVSAMWQSTRREVWHAALGTTAMAALPYTSCTSSMRHDNGTERVVIVGAGLAGLHAAARLDAMSITAWLAEIPEANALIKAILEVAYVGEFGLEADDQSVFNLLRLIDFKSPEAFRLFGESDERFYRGVTVITPAMSLPPLSP